MHLCEYACVCVCVCVCVYMYVCRFIYESDKHNGVAELLEILGRFVHTHTHNICTYIIQYALKKTCLKLPED